MRRSSRARVTQPPQNGPANSGSNSSNSSTKDERTQRSMTRQESQVKSATPRSASPDESGTRDRPAEQETRRTRQHRRGEGEEQPGAEDDDDEGEDDEVTRCVCRKAEYPGPPVPLEENQRSNRSRDSHGATEGQPELAGDLFIQCDICQVWQHGGCVGIMTNEQAPNNYYCEMCKPEEHKLMVGARGQRYSRYLPVVGYGSEPPKNKVHARRPSDVKGEQDKKPPKEGDNRLFSPSAPGGRRSTMNSRVAWEEEQNLLRAIEESRGAEGGTRRNKRSHEESEESNHDPKRRKTESNTGTPPLEAAEDEDEVSDGEPDENGRSKGTNGSNRKARTVAAQAQREREMRRREKDREREKTEAANKRKERAGRRRGEDSPSPPPAPPPEAPKAPTSRNTKSRNQVGGKAQTAETPPHSSSGPGRKVTRIPPRRGRAGRSYQTRDADKVNSPGGSDDASNNADLQLLSNGSKPSRPKSFSINRTTMNELRKRAAAISEFITRTQVELAGANTPPEDQMSAPTPQLGINRVGTGSSMNGSSKLSREINEGQSDENKPLHQPADVSTKIEEEVDEAAFRELSTLEMMDVLSRRIIGFQREHGKYGEK